MGLEKVVKKLTDVPPLLRLLTGSATGQMVTTYVNMISSPRTANEKDGPKEVHLIILDNGRSDILADRQLRETLLCIRCGTCLNHCPVYIRIGGHAYGFVYPGPIGKILTPQMAGLRTAGDHTTASSLCGACSEVCPVKIPIPDLIRRLRNDAYGNTARSAVKEAGAKKCSAERVVWKGWALVNRAPALNTANAKLLAKTRGKLPNQGPLAAWTRVRCQPLFASTSLRELAQKNGVDDE
jgi:L-lactate dehydrogenase complex protein LldF